MDEQRKGIFYDIANNGGVRVLRLFHLGAVDVAGTSTDNCCDNKNKQCPCHVVVVEMIKVIPLGGQLLTSVIFPEPAGYPPGATLLYGSQSTMSLVSKEKKSLVLRKICLFTGS